MTTINASNLKNIAIDNAIEYRRKLGILIVDLELAYDAITREVNSDNPIIKKIQESK